MSFDFVDNSSDCDLSVRRGATYRKVITAPITLPWTAYSDININIPKTTSDAILLTLSVTGGELVISGASDEILTLTITKAQSDAIAAGVRIYEWYNIDGAECLHFQSGRIEFKSSSVDT